MTAHDQKDASSRINITSLTMLSDCRNSSKIERVGDTVPGSAVVSMDCIDGGLLWRLLDDRWKEVTIRQVGRARRASPPVPGAADRHARHRRRAIRARPAPL